VNKTRFIELVKDPQKILEKDLSQIQEISSQYPYSQVLHILNAKGQHQLDKESAPQIIQRAATYCHDRTLLKQFIEAGTAPAAPPLPDTEPEAPVWEQEIVKQEPANFDWIEEEETSGTALEKEDTSSSIEETSDPTKVTHAPESTEPSKAESEELDDPLEEAVEESVITPPAVEPLEEAATEEPAVLVNEDSAPPTEAEVPDLPIDEEPAEVEPVDTVEGAEEDSTTSPDHPAEAASTTGEEITLEKDEPEKDEQVKEDPEKQTDANTDDAPDTKAKDDPADKNILDQQIAAELHSSSIHAELMDNLSRLKENRQQFQESPELSEDMVHTSESEIQLHHDQIQIIDNFIKNSPVLSKPNLSADSEATSQKDLSKRSTTFNDQLVTEQLAKILIKQGNNKEAIKIYKKLIRKFPKKKSYFAGQIENLSK